MLVFSSGLVTNDSLPLLAFTLHLLTIRLNQRIQNPIRESGSHTCLCIRALRLIVGVSSLQIHRNPNKQTKNSTDANLPSPATGASKVVKSEWNIERRSQLSGLRQQLSEPNSKPRIKHYPNESNLTLGMKERSKRLELITRNKE